MCGIFACIGTDSAFTKTISGLKKLDYRGYDSWGIAYPHAKKLTTTKHLGSVTSPKHTPANSNTAIGHTRWATHGGVTTKNTHPHLDCTHRLAIVHNGVIENYVQLKSKLKNHHFVSQTDTEVFAHLLEDLVTNLPIDQAVRQAFSQIEGYNAIVILDRQTNSLVAIKSGSPLIIGAGKTGYFIASDAHALVGHATSAHYLEDHTLVTLTSTELNLFDTNHQPTPPKLEPLSISSASASKGRFPHFLLKEIHDQPALIRSLTKTFSPSSQLIHSLTHSRSINFFGCGTAHYAALFGSTLFSSQNHLLTRAIVGSQAATTLPAITSKDLCLFLSQSGETIDLLEPLTYLNQNQIPTLALTNSYNSSLYRATNHQILLTAGPEIAVVSTKAFIAKLTLLLLLSAAMSPDPDTHNLSTQLNSASRDITKLLQPTFNRHHLSPVIKYLSRHPHIFVLGRGLSYPIALEAALKIKESSYLHAEAFAAGELKHGVLALIDQNTPIIVFAPKDSTFQDNLTACQEVKARGGTIIGISPTPESVFDYHLSVPNRGLATHLSHTVIAQLLGYHLALAKNLNPDKPRNLAKSVTVK